MPERIVSLDVIRGIAVLGIFSVNVVGMGLIEQAYSYPPAAGFGGLGDRIMWAANFILVDGKFRSLFSILFGASTVLVIERGIAAGKSPGEVHYPRMIVLLLFGLAHYYLLWWGDILANYALVGMLAFVFWPLGPRWQLLAAICTLGLFYVPQAAEGVVTSARFEAMTSSASTAQQPATIAQELAGLRLSPAQIAREKAQHASIPAHARAMLRERPGRPFASVFSYGLETLGLMLLGMAGYKSGFLTGSWSRRRYACIAGALVTASLALYGYAAWRIVAADFRPETYFAWDQAYVSWMHPFAATGYAASIMLIYRGNALTRRLAAAGRAAFTNYLGATLIGTALFFGTGMGLFEELSRGQAWLIVPIVWAAMLLWSKPWLERFRYGPFEWAWRSLSRWRWEPMRRISGPASRAGEFPAA